MGDLLNAYSDTDLLNAYSDMELNAGYITHLLRVTAGLMDGLDFTGPDGERNETLDQIHALVNVLAGRSSELEAELRGVWKMIPRPAQDRAECSEGTPSLINAIQEYRAGIESFNAIPEADTIEEEEAVVEATYGPPMNKLCDWDQPLQSLQEVRAAIQLAFDEKAVVDDVAGAPLRAALAYLENCKVAPASLRVMQGSHDAVQMAHA